VVNNSGIRGAYNNSEPPKMLVEIANAGHYAWSNGCFPSPDCNPPTTMSQDEAHDAVRRWVLPFLEVHLRGNSDFLPFVVPPAPPGFVLKTEP
jgi:hypothetical protein